MEKPSTLHPETWTAQGLGGIDPETGGLAPALHPATTFERDPGYGAGRSYGRADNPTFELPEAMLARLEGAAEALIFSSGVAAATAVFLTLRPGDHVVAPRIMYWGLRKWLVEFGARWGVDVELVDMERIDALAAAIRPGRTRIVWIETPANPTWIVTDIAKAAELTHAVGARLAIDNTVPTPVLTRPIELGADFVMHSATKYLNGHSDMIGGALAAAEPGDLWEEIRAIRAGNGAILGTFEAWLLQRGMRTLFLRVDRACRSAQAIAEYFAGHRHVAAVLYPGLPDFDGHALAARQMKGGFGGMLSIRVTGGPAAAIATAAQVRVWKRATSLGSVESLIEHRRSVEDAQSLCPPDLLRLSVGIEHPDDLIADLDQALRNAHA